MNLLKIVGNIPIVNNKDSKENNPNIPNQSLFKKLGLDIITSNNKVLSPNFKKDNYIFSPSASKNINAVKNSMIPTNKNAGISNIKQIVLNNGNNNSTDNNIINHFYTGRILLKNKENTKNLSELDKALIKLNENLNNGRNLENFSGQNHQNISYGISEREVIKRLDERSISPTRKNNFLEESDSNLMNISLEDFSRHFTLFEIFLEIEVVYLNIIIFVGH